MTATDYIADTTALLTGWGIDYRETTEGLSVGSIHLEIAEDGWRPKGTILAGTETVAITNDADKAAALLAFPLARRAWELGYTGDFEIDVLNGEMEMRLSWGSDSLTISADVDSDCRLTVTEHPLLLESVYMSDIEAVLESAQLAYGNPEGAWQAICTACDFEMDDWATIVDKLDQTARFDYGDTFTVVETSRSDSTAIVEDWGDGSPIRVSDADDDYSSVCWSQYDIAAAVLYAIS